MRFGGMEDHAQKRGMLAEGAGGEVARDDTTKMREAPKIAAPCESEG